MNCKCDIWNTGCLCDLSAVEETLQKDETACNKIRTLISDLEKRIKSKTEDIFDSYFSGQSSKLDEIRLDALMTFDMGHLKRELRRMGG